MKNPLVHYRSNKPEPGRIFPDIILGKKKECKILLTDSGLLGSAKSWHWVQQSGLPSQSKLSPFKSQDITNAHSSHGQARKTEEERPNPHHWDLRYSLELASSEKHTSKHYKENKKDTMVLQNRHYGVEDLLNQIRYDHDFIVKIHVCLFESWRWECFL